MAEENNGGDNHQAARISQILLTLDRINFVLSIDGHAENTDEAICIVEMALRQLKEKRRAEHASAVLRLGGRMPSNFDPRGPRRA
jgi:hypothetical protein